jgi:hypothetical protein
VLKQTQTQLEEEKNKNIELAQQNKSLNGQLKLTSVEKS